MRFAVTVHALVPVSAVLEIESEHVKQAHELAIAAVHRVPSGDWKAQETDGKLLEPAINAHVRERGVSLDAPKTPPPAVQPDEPYMGTSETHPRGGTGAENQTGE